QIRIAMQREQAFDMGKNPRRLAKKTARLRGAGTPEPQRDIGPHGATPPFLGRSPCPAGQGGAGGDKQKAAAVHGASPGLAAVRARRLSTGQVPRSFITT